MFDTRFEMVTLGPKKWAWLGRRMVLQFGAYGRGMTGEWQVAVTQQVGLLRAALAATGDGIGCHYRLRAEVGLGGDLLAELGLVRPIRQRITEDAIFDVLLHVRESAFRMRQTVSIRLGVQERQQ